MKYFYVCSYGGCGSKVLCNYLKHFGIAYHVHSRNPPKKLTGVGHNVYMEWFNTKIISDTELNSNEYYVIYIYRNPVESIYSRLKYKAHLLHIQCENTDLQIKDIVEAKKDLYGITEFFDNYTTANSDRNYKIYCIKYEKMFENIENINKLFNLNNYPKLYPQKKESIYNYEYKDELTDIYNDLINRINDRTIITIVAIPPISTSKLAAGNTNQGKIANTIRIHPIFFFRVGFSSAMYPSFFRA